MGRGQYDRQAARERRLAAQTPPIVVIPAEPAPALPEPVVPLAEDVPPAMRLIAPHGYIEDRFNRGVYHWPAGTVLTNPDEIEHLQARGAEMEPVL